jgi:hypothetical protein
VYRALVGLEADPTLGDLEQNLLRPLAAQYPRFATLLEERHGSQG